MHGGIIMPIDGFAAYDYSSSVSKDTKKNHSVVLAAIPLYIVPGTVLSTATIVAPVPVKKNIQKSKKKRTRIINIPETVTETSVSDAELRSRTLLDNKKFFDDLETQRQYTLQKQQANLKRKNFKKSAPRVIQASALKPVSKIIIAPTLADESVKSKLKLEVEENFLPKNNNLIIDDEIADNIKEQVDRIKSETNLIPVLPHIRDYADWIGAGAIMTMAGIILAPVTWGVSLGVSCVGMGIALIGSIIAIVKSIQYFVSKHQYENDMRDYLNNHFLENRNYHRVGEIHGRVFYLKESADSFGFVMRDDGLIESFRKTHDGVYQSTGVFSEMAKAVRVIKAEHISNEFKLNAKKNKSNVLPAAIHSSSSRSLTLFGNVGQPMDKVMQDRNQSESREGYVALPSML
jgi:hypothetical protein